MAIVSWGPICMVLPVVVVECSILGIDSVSAAAVVAAEPAAGEVAVLLPHAAISSDEASAKRPSDFL